MMDRSPSFWMKILLHRKNGTAGGTVSRRFFTVLLHKIFRILLSKNLENVFIKYRNREKKKNITKGNARFYFLKQVKINIFSGFS